MATKLLTEVQASPNDLPLGGEVCAPSQRGQVRQLVKAKDAPTPGWVKAQAMHSKLTDGIDGKKAAAKSRKLARLEARLKSA
jgi:hypothetical protein